MNVEELAAKLGVKRRDFNGREDHRRSIRDQVRYLSLRERIEGFRCALESELEAGALVGIVFSKCQSFTIEGPATVILVGAAQEVVLTTSAKFLRRIHRQNANKRCEDILRSCFAGLFPQMKNYWLRIVRGSEVPDWNLSSGETLEVSIGSESFPILLQVANLPTMLADESRVRLRNQSNAAIVTTTLNLELDCVLYPMDLSNLDCARPFDRFYLKNEFADLRATLRPVEAESMKPESEALPIEVRAFFRTRRNCHGGPDSILVSLEATNLRPMLCS